MKNTFKYIIVLVVLVTSVLVINFSVKTMGENSTLKTEAKQFESGVEADVVLEFSSSDVANAVTGALRQYEYVLDNNKIIMTAEEAALIDGLNVSGYAITDATEVLQFLKLPNLKTMSLRMTSNLINTSEIAKLTNLERLSIGDVGLRDISFFSTMTNLKTLYLSDQDYITDFSPITSLTGLEELSIGYFEDISTLDFSGFTNLKKFGLNDGDATEFPNITNITTLEEIYIRSTEVASIPDLSNLVNLRALQLEYNNISTIADNAFNSLPNLELVNIKGNSVTNVPLFPDSPLLRILLLSHNNIENVDFLKNLPALEVAELNNNNISSIENVANLPALLELDLSGNEIKTVVADFSLFKNLTELKITSSELADLSSLASLTNLSILEITNSEISDVTPLASLPSLQRLYLSGNIIEDISPLFDLDLIELDVSGNRIEDFNSIVTSSNLWNNMGYLNLNDNIIKDISEIDGLTEKNSLINLNWLTLRQNQIENIENLEAASDPKFNLQTQIFDVYLKDKQDYTLPSWVAKTQDSNSVYHSYSGVNASGATVSPDYTTVSFDQGEVSNTYISVGYYRGAGVFDGARINFHFDAVAPVLQMTNTPNQGYSSVIKITSNEPLQALEGWTLSRDELTLTKEYFDNVNEQVLVADKAGNTSPVTVEISHITTGRLASLTIDENEIELFQNVYEYDVSLLSHQTTINIEAIPIDLSATVLGDGEIFVNKTSMPVLIIVTAITGETKTYTVNITREVSTNNSVSLITPSIGTFDKIFDPSIKEYTLEVENDVATLSFDVIKTSEVATLDGHETKTVLNGTNIRIISITAEDGSENMYTITVIKRPSDVTLKTLTVAGYAFNFEPNTYTYDINVSSNKKTMLETEITAIATDSNATVNLAGNIDLPNSYVIEVVGSDNYTKLEYTINIDNTNDYYALTSDIYTVEDELIYADNITITDLVNSFNNNKSIRVYKESSIYYKDTSTDMELRLVINNHVYDSAKIIVLGDINGDSNINIIDKILLINHNNTDTNLEGIYLLASDINKDSTVTAEDLNLIDKLIIKSE